MGMNEHKTAIEFIKRQVTMDNKYQDDDYRCCIRGLLELIAKLLKPQKQHEHDDTTHTVSPNTALMRKLLLQIMRSAIFTVLRKPLLL